MLLDFPGSSAGKEIACNAGNPSSTSGLGRPPGELIGYPLHYSWASLVAQMIKNLPAMRETRVQSLGQEDALEKGMATHSRILVCLITQLCLTPCDPMDCSPPGSSREILHGNFPGKNTGEGCHALLQGIFLIWGSNPGLLHCRWIV